MSQIWSDFLAYGISYFINNDFTMSGGLKENRDLHNLPTKAHPSLQTVPIPRKPCIKIGYQIVPPEPSHRRYKKAVLLPKRTPSHHQGLKLIKNKTLQTQSGAFEHCEYVSKNTHSTTRYQRKGVEEAREKYQSGRGCSSEMGQRNEGQKGRSRMARSITERPSTSRLSVERSKLSGYRGEGIKGILEYQHAGEYREAEVTGKCNKEAATSRCKSFGDLHEFDFRKSKPLRY